MSDPAPNVDVLPVSDTSLSSQQSLRPHAFTPLDATALAAAQAASRRRLVFCGFLIAVSLVTLALMLVFNAPVVESAKKYVTAIALISVGLACWSNVQLDLIRTCSASSQYANDAMLDRRDSVMVALTHFLPVSELKRIAVGLAFVLWGIQAVAEGDLSIVLNDLVLVLFILDCAHSSWQDSRQLAMRNATHDDMRESETLKTAAGVTSDERKDEVELA